MAAITYDIAGVHFASQTELAKRVKEELAKRPRDVVFLSRFFRDIVNQHHPEVIAAGQESTGEFEILTWGEQERRGMKTARKFRGGIVVRSRFMPLDQWQDVTVYPWRRGTFRGACAEALREKMNQRLPSPTDLDKCAVTRCPQRGRRLEYHHITPTFATMFAQVWPLITEEERATRFEYNKFKKGAVSLEDFIPDDHPAILALAALHESNTWQWLCRQHHVAAP